MNVRAYLEQVKAASKRVDFLGRELEHLRGKAYQAGAAVVREDGVKGSGKKDYVGDFAAGLADLEAELDSALSEYAGLRRDVSALIEGLKNELQREVMRLRYLEFCDWGEIVGRTRFSDGHIFKQHWLGIKKLQSKAK